MMSGPVVCPRCGAVVRRHAKFRGTLPLRCRKCGSHFTASVGENGSVKVQLDDPPVESSNTVSFHLTSLLFSISVIGICLWLFPGLGIVVAILALPLLVRTAWVVKARKRADVATGRLPEVARFAHSLAVSSLVMALLLTTIFGCLVVCVFLTCAAAFTIGPLSIGVGATCIFGSIWIVILVSRLTWKWLIPRLDSDTGQDEGQDRKDNGMADKGETG